MQNSPVPPTQCWDIAELTHTNTQFLLYMGQGKRKKRLKVAAFPTLLTIIQKLCHGCKILVNLLPLDDGIFNAVVVGLGGLPKCLK